MILHHLLILLIINYCVATSPTNGYAPGPVSCPSSQLIRSGSQGINPNEQSYINARYPIAKQALSKFLHNANLQNFDVDSFLAHSNPTIGLAFSGGGYRAMLTGAGEISSLDSRTKTNTPVLAGILQASSYIAGLSGGSWLVGSLASNNLNSVDDMLSQGLWELTHSFLSYYGIEHPIKQVEEWVNVGNQVASKRNANFNVSLTDIYGRLLSYPLLTNTEDEGDAYLWSDVTSASNFQSHQMPFPILISDGRAPDTTIINLNSTVIELTPYEFGSWDPSLNEFVDTRYLGTKLDNGRPTGKCYNGFNNAGFFMGTSSALFNEAVLSITEANIPSFLKDIIDDILVDPILKSNIDVSAYNPNPFFKSSGSNTAISQSKNLYLVDGGEDGQNIPISPLLHRNVSAIFAFDNSNDVLNWPDGTSLVKTYERQFSSQGNGIAFPYVPDQYTFRNLNLTSKPTFFGCDAKNLTSLTNDIYDVPLVIYLANRPFTYWSNTSTFKLTYDDNERQGMISNGFEIATRSSGSLDDEWAACVGCAIIRREQERQGIEQTEQCKRCFENYCWDGTIYKGEPLGENFSDDGLTNSATEYNLNNVAGFNDGGTLILKKA